MLFCEKLCYFLVLIFWGENWSVLIFTPFATMVDDDKDILVMKRLTAMLVVLMRS